MQDQVLVGEFNCYNLKFYQKLRGTNLEAKHLAENVPHCTVVCAEKQTEGRGKGDRIWISPPGNLYMSLILHYKRDLEDLLQLSFVFSLAIGRVLEGLTKLKVSYKWPNDVLLCDKKIAGVLLESYAHHEKNTVVVIGAGLNILSYPGYTNFPATSLAEFIVSDKLPSPPDLLKQILLQFDALEYEWRMFGFLGIKNMWMQQAFRLYGKIKVDVGTCLYEGIFSGIDKSGNLILFLPNGHNQLINYGDILNLGV
jgi:BirA family biotin operon repressor/biotin-[acetyl-CoA-carboxylase] ligase